MKVITTKYHGATDHRGSRISASDGDGNRVTTPYRSECDTEENHRAGAVALCERMDWHGEIVGDTQMAGGKIVGMVWVWLRPSIPRATV